jgi:hypothetical protein
MPHAATPIFVILSTLISFTSSIRHLRASTDSSRSISRSMRSLAFLSVSFLTMTDVFFNTAVIYSCCFALPVSFALSRSRSVRSLTFSPRSPRMTPVDLSNAA